MTLLVLLRGAIGAGKSSVARALQALDPHLTIVEVDDIKRAKFGTTWQSHPVADFPEAGHRVRKRLEQDRPVILVESFCEHYHIQLALNPVIHLRANVDLFVVCLHCELDTAIARKHPELPRDVIEREYARFSSRAKVPGEIVVATDHRPATHIAKHLFSLWTPAESTGV